MLKLIAGAVIGALIGAGGGYVLGRETAPTPSVCREALRAYADAYDALGIDAFEVAVDEVSRAASAERRC